MCAQRDRAIVGCRYYSLVSSSIPPTKVRSALSRIFYRLLDLARKIVRVAKRAAKYEIYAFWRSRPVRPTVVFYESFAGNGMLCNPEAIFRALHADAEFANFTHVWALKNFTENSSVVTEFRNDPRVRFVRSNSWRYFRALATSGYLINNATFPPEFGKRTGQLYLNTWHGTPLKKMGFDIGDSASRVGNVIRNFLIADYLLAANRFTVDTLYESAHRLDELYTGKFIEEGYPRIDQQFMTPVQDADTRARLVKAGVNIGTRQMVLYAPTWKGTNFNQPDDDIADLVARVVELESLIDTEKYAVVLKTHQVVHKFAGNIPALVGRLAPNEIATNSILGVTDALITDYSSTFFDFLPTGRPIFFLAPDIADYSGYRGLYLDAAEWPGPVLDSVAALAAAINELDTVGRSPQILDNYEKARARFAPHEDGHATERVIDIVFRGKTHGYRVSSATKTHRKTILINAGRFAPNGISSSLLNLLDGLDYARFDVSVIFASTKNPLIVHNHRSVNPNVRQFARVGGMSGSKLAHVRRRFAWLRGDLRSHGSSRSQNRLWDNEWARCFGATTFDFSIDFTGYGPMWAMLMLHAQGAERSIWLHNDLAADSRRRAVGKRNQLRDLTGIFSLYREYDHLVSVSPTLAQINARSLAKYADPSVFESAPNLVNELRVRANMAVNVTDASRDELTGAVPEWARDLAARPYVTTFVTVGRLSPEKNHARLIRAFALVHAHSPNTRLLIVGSGALSVKLEAQISSLGLTEAVWLTGHQTNPHAILAASDCFVLSSNYEGQPMVILEAMLVGLPVVTVDFGSVADSMPAGTGAVVPSTDEGLASGLTAFLSGTVTIAPFDATVYNAVAVEQFYRAIGAAAKP